MTHAAIDQYTEIRTAQRCPWVARAWIQRRGDCHVVVAPIFNIPAPSISVYPGGPVVRRIGPLDRVDSCSNVQACPESDSRSARSGGVRWDDDQQDSIACTLRLPCGFQPPWLNGETASPLPFVSSTNLTVCSHQNWNRLMEYWFPKGQLESQTQDNG